MVTSALCADGLVDKLGSPSICTGRQTSPAILSCSTFLGRGEEMSASHESLDSRNLGHCVELTADKFQAVADWWPTGYDLLEQLESRERVLHQMNTDSVVTAP
jgi:hypothetical protein